MKRTHPGMVAEARRALDRSSQSLRLEAAGQLAIPLGRSFPVRPSAQAVEQRVLAIDTTIQAAYEKWRATPEGEMVVTAMLHNCRHRLLAGERRIGMKSVAEQTRDRLKIELNNNYVALIARELIESDPRLDALIQRRERKST